MSDEITIKISVPDSVCADIMATAYEGGIGYWAQSRTVHVFWDDGRGRMSGVMPDLPRSISGWGYQSIELLEMNDEEDYDWDAPDAKPWILTYKEIRGGIEKILDGKVPVRSYLRAQILTATYPDNVDIDADAADCIVQAAMFGELKYG